MQPKEFLGTIYLGDRGCKSVLIDGWEERVFLQVTTISRVRNASGNWEYYTDEDIQNGQIVFTGVASVRFEPPGFVPNDSINALDVDTIPTDGTENITPYYLFRIFVDSVSKDGLRTEVQIQIEARDIHLEDPNRPGIKIQD